MIDALCSTGLLPDGRLTALSSYENRVYLAHQDDGDKVVAKFYRPGRWSLAQIEEEHAFSQELADKEIPVVAPLVLQGRTVHEHAGFLFSVSPCRGGRRPELDDWEVLEWTGRFLARIHTEGSARPFAHRPALDLRSFGFESMNYLLEHDMVALDVRKRWEQACEQALHLIAPAADGSARPAISACKAPAISACMAIVIRATSCGRRWTTRAEAARTRGPRRCAHGPGRAGPVDAALGRARPADAAVVGPARRLRTIPPLRPARAGPDRALRTLRLIHYSAWLARRWQDPIFAINFPWFGTADYWRSQVDMLHEQIEAIQREPLYA